MKMPDKKEVYTYRGTLIPDSIQVGGGNGPVSYSRGPNQQLLLVTAENFKESSHDSFAAKLAGPDLSGLDADSQFAAKLLATLHNALANDGIIDGAERQDMINQIMGKVNFGDIVSGILSKAKDVIGKKKP